MVSDSSGNSLLNFVVQCVPYEVRDFCMFMACSWREGSSNSLLLGTCSPCIPSPAVPSKVNHDLWH